MQRRASTSPIIASPRPPTHARSSLTSAARAPWLLRPGGSGSGAEVRFFSPSGELVGSEQRDEVTPALDELVCRALPPTAALDGAREVLAVAASEPGPAREDAHPGP